MILTRSGQRDWEMTFFIGRGFAELQILKKWKWPYSLNWVECCDEILHTHWYWHDVAHEIVKWQLGLVEVLPRIKFWNFAYTLKLTRCTPWDCQMTFEIGLVLPRFKFCKKCDYCKMTKLSSVEALPSAKFWKSENGLISWTEWNIWIDFCVNIDIINILPKRLWNVIFHRSRFCRSPNSEQVKMALSLELSGILWWNLAYTLVYWQDDIWDWSRFCRGSNSENSEN